MRGTCRILENQDILMKGSLSKAIVPLALGAVIALIPAPQGLDHSAWYFFAIFASVIAGLILEPMPAAAVGFVGVFLIAVLGLAGSSPADSIRWALSGFSNTTVWLIFGAFMFALGYDKTGLGRRLGLIFVRTLGRSSLGLGYAITFADLVLAPFTPSNTARSGGTIYPIIRNLPGLYGSSPGETARRMGAYIMWTAFAATCVTSSMFLTALAPNLLALELVHKTAGFRIGWSEWFLGFLPVGGILILILPYLIYKIYPPGIKSGKEVPLWASEELLKLGKISRREWIMAFLAILALSGWIFAGGQIDPTAVAGVVISLMMLTGIITWDDILANRQAWNVLVWFATLVALADGLNKVGFIAWFANITAAGLTGISPVAGLVLLIAVFFGVHYLFASLTAHTAAILPVILAAGSAMPGLPMKVFALLLCYALGIMGVITPYATGPAPVYFGSGYLSRRDFWLLGLIFGVIFLLALLGLGVPYLLAVYGS
jgi:L-tartrate/succinate antiporter